MKAYYSEYVQHCIRFYFKVSEPVFKSSIDERNWRAVEWSLLFVTSEEQELLRAVYTGQGLFSENVKAVADNNELPITYIWKLVADLEKRVARKRELV